MPSDAIDRREATRQYLLRWQTIGPVLDGIRFRELGNSTAAERSRDIEALLAASDYMTPNDTRGWEAWQKVRERWQSIAR